MPEGSFSQIGAHIYIYIYIYINHSLVTNSNRMHKKEAVIRTEDEVDNRSAKENKE